MMTLNLSRDKEAKNVPRIEDIETKNASTKK